MRDFVSDVAILQSEGKSEVEVDPRVIAHFHPQGLGDAGYFWFQGVKVFPKGGKEAALAKERRSVEDILFRKPS